MTDDYGGLGWSPPGCLWITCATDMTWKHHT
jgi:hypothetical protein